MPDTLPPPPSLAELGARSPLALFLDFDGTLVELADTPDGISVPETLLADLCALASRHEGRVALVSGRAIDNLEEHLGPCPLAVAGSHGIHRRRADGSLLGEVPEGLPPAAEAALEDFTATQGSRLERKPHGAALHFRERPELEEEGAAFAAALADEHGLEVKRGKRVIELVRPGADKGGAVRAFMDTSIFAGSHPVFIGDDTTDEDGFAAVTALGGTAILVGDRRPTSAPFALANPDTVHEWLGL